MIPQAAQLWRVTRELDLGHLRRAFERTDAVEVLGSDRVTAESVARLLGSEGGTTTLRVGVLGSSAAAWDIGSEQPLVRIAALGETADGRTRRALAELTGSDVPLLVVHTGAEDTVVVIGLPEEQVLALDPFVDPQAARGRLLGALAACAPESLLALGREHPAIRPQIARRLIRDTSVANAQFAALSSIPANLPFIGGLVATAGDTVVLTKNQAVLLFKLAGLYGRDLRLGRDLILEVLPVVGGAFLWRSAARTAIGLLPGLLAIGPKIAVAYTGTFVVGELAHYYYRYGREAPPGLAGELQTEGLRLARRGLNRIRGRKGE